MSSLVAKIQWAILGGQFGAPGPEDLRELLRQLQIPAGRTPVPGAITRIRRCLLYGGASEHELREAFADLGLTGGAGGDKRQAMQNVRNAVLRNL